MRKKPLAIAAGCRTNRLELGGQRMREARFQTEASEDRRGVLGRWLPPESRTGQLDAGSSWTG